MLYAMLPKSGARNRAYNLLGGGNWQIIGGDITMKTSTETQQEVIAENNLASNVVRMKERNLHILYICLGVGIILLASGLISYLIK
jgi:hypothetical protein